MRTGKMVQWVERLAVEFDNLSLVPGTHLVGEKELQTVL